mmetsp:Transcript_40603/g.59656  ORF Transcript_40603/g.59656 Transcript_40603/m.59656 type:complete len:202 (+) Transcript_40603:202-807(+)
MKSYILPARISRKKFRELLPSTRTSQHHLVRLVFGVVAIITLIISIIDYLVEARMAFIAVCTMAIQFIMDVVWLKVFLIAYSKARSRQKQPWHTPRDDPLAVLSKNNKAQYKEAIDLLCPTTTILPTHFRKRIQKLLPCFLPNCLLLAKRIFHVGCNHPKRHFPLPVSLPVQPSHLHPKHFPNFFRVFHSLNRLGVVLGSI